MHLMAPCVHNRVYFCSLYVLTHCFVDSDNIDNPTHEQINSILHDLDFGESLKLSKFAVSQDFK